MVCVHTWWCYARPCRRRSQRGEAEEAWALRRSGSTMMTDSSLAAPSVTASEETERREEEEQAFKAGIALILSR